MFLDWLFDGVSIGMDLHDIQQEGLSWNNGLTLAGDIGLAVLPFVPSALGHARRGMGYIRYGDLDDLGRATGVEAVITRKMLNSGTSAKQSIYPSGWIEGARNQARGHLLGKQLGGSGSDKRNLVTLVHDPINHPVMSSLEGAVHAAVRGGETVWYSVTPLYKGMELKPVGLTFQAVGTSGFFRYITIMNR